VVKIVLITRRSLGSAWVFTESVGEGEDKPQLRLFDGSDAPLMTLLSTWQPPVRHGATHFREDLLNPLQKAYREEWDAGMPASREVLDGAAGTSSGWKRRPDKFLEGARQLLFVMGDATLAIYPFRPETWSGNAKFLNFSEAVSLVLRRPGVAMALGLTIPPSLLLRADQVIE
jgi:hypothetical protein